MFPFGAVATGATKRAKFPLIGDSVLAAEAPDPVAEAPGRLPKLQRRRERPLLGCRVQRPRGVPPANSVGEVGALGSAVSGFAGRAGSPTPELAPVAPGKSIVRLVANGRVGLLARAQRALPLSRFIVALPVEPKHELASVGVERILDNRC